MGATRYLVNAAIKDGQRLLALENQLAAKATPEEAKAFRKREIRAAIFACVAPLLIAWRGCVVFGIDGILSGISLILMAASWHFAFLVIGPSRVRDLQRRQLLSQDDPCKRS